MGHDSQKNLFGSEDLPPLSLPWEEASDRLSAEIVFDLPLETTFHYLVPDDLREMIQPGQRVRAPFGRGNRPTVGYCVSLGPPPKIRHRLKELAEIIDQEPLLSPNMLDLTKWIAEEYLCGWGQVLQSVIPAGVKKKAGTRLIQHYQPAPNVRERLVPELLPPKQRAVMDVLCDSPVPMRIEELTEAAQCGTGPVNALRNKGLIQAVRQRTEIEDGQFDEETAIPRIEDLKLNEVQHQALDTILQLVRSGKHQTVLLHGVTGSGKTEVYIQAIREIVSYGRQAIVLVPEISLTPQTIRRFRQRFDSVAVLHSHLSDAERHWHWQQIARGAVQVVVGARSAVFAPIPHLGMIIIDEEHESSFKQETTPRYHAREVARQRAMRENVPLILGSATPTLESWHRAKQKKDLLISMPNRVEQRSMPPVVIVDIRNDPQIRQGSAIGRALHQAIRGALEDQGQVILFLNLRGHSPVLWCRGCGGSLKCPNCDITLTWHKDRNVALCHSCDHHCPPPTHCPTCGQAGMRFLGIGTQRLEAEVKARFPEGLCLRMDSDSMRKPGSHDQALERFRKGDVQILLGTQMIAKGLDFPNVTLVGVISADTVLHQPDMRASERTFQLISQVAGRTGRGSRAGRVLVQTSCPAEPAILKAAEHDFVTFAEQELKHRREMLAPPYYHFARVIVRGPEESAVQDLSLQMADKLREASTATGDAVYILGPAPAPIAKLKSYYRYHFQLAAEDLTDIQHLWRTVHSDLPQVHDIEYTIDVDPLNMR